MTTDKAKEQEKARSEDQLSFERRVQREMLAVGKKTDAMSKKRYAGGIEGDGSNPPMAPSIPGESKVKKGKQLQKKTKKGAKK